MSDTATRLRSALTDVHDELRETVQHERTRELHQRAYLIEAALREVEDSEPSR